LNRLGSGQHHCERHTSISVIYLPMRVGIQFWVASLGVRFLGWGWPTS
jgi:hypothetical protein